ncbi:MAG TPA: ABC transporter permease [Acetobacteraceae bacterium]|nr:ABC transporter permease [Acetobacteraceae bacterium]
MFPPSVVTLWHLGSEVKLRSGRHKVETATFERVERAAGTALVFSGRLDADGVAQLWTPTLKAASRAKGKSLLYDLSAVSFCDTAGATLLVAAENAHGEPARLAGEAENLHTLLDRVRRALPPSRPTPRRAWRPIFHPIKSGLSAAANGVAFLGETVLAVILAPRRLRMLRPGDLFAAADQAGVRAMPLIFLLGFLIGLILAFQSAVPMQAFGAVIYVANLVSIGLLRELGPLLAAVILSGRTASAFAAEIGTMKVNEEIDALSTMGLDPVTMLVLPRLIAAVLVMPMLTIGLEIAGLAGMTVVLEIFGFPLVAILRQVQSAATLTDFWGGLFKAICFAAVVAAIGCNRGLTTGQGPRAVGVSTTAAVVGGIVATIALDGIFALVFYRLNL